MEPGPKPPNRIDNDGLRHVAPTWESLVDRQIREAMEEGKFDDLPHQGEPLPPGAPTCGQHRRPLVLADELARLDELHRR